MKRAGAGRSRLPSQALDCPTDLADRAAKLDVQSVVARAITDAFPNSELEEAADAVEVRVHSRHRGKGLSIGGAFQANAPEAASEHLCVRTARLSSEGIESDKVILVDAERNHSRFLLSLATRLECGTTLRVKLDGQRRARLVDLTLTWRCEIR